MPVGVDWASGSWLAVGVGDGLTVAVESSFADLVAGFEDDLILVDMPIGLVSSGWLDGRDDHRRACDRLARSVLGGRSSSVFPPPAREALDLIRDGSDHETASAANRAATGAGLPVQTYHIAGPIAAVDSYLQSNPGAVGRVREAHPEVCLRAFADAPLSAGKTTAPGFGERLAALDAVADAPERTVRTVAERLLDHDTDADIDDVVDAVALAHTAAAPQEELRTLPPDPPTDAADLPMEMVYRARSPLIE